MTDVGVIGLGGMGSRMARRLLEAGHRVVVWNRTPGKADDLVAAGASAAESPAELARQVDVVLTMLSDPAALQAVVEGPDGLAAGPPSTVIEMSTMGPAAIEWLTNALPEGWEVLDAPVLGSLSEVEAGTLVVFAAGPKASIERWTPLLATFGRVLYAGPSRSGAAAKLVANSTLLAVLTGLGEALALADALGLSRAVAFEVLGTTPLAAQAERRRDAIEKGQYPHRFSLELARKDADLIAEAATSAGVELPVARAARDWFVAAEQEGRGAEDYSAILAHILGARPTDAP